MTYYTESIIMIISPSEKEKRDYCNHNRYFCILPKPKTELSFKLEH